MAPPDIALVTRLIETQFPELAPARVAEFGAGCDSVAFDVNGSWVFKFPTRADVDAQLDVEMRVLPALAAPSPIPLPAYRFRGRPTRQHAFRQEYVNAGARVFRWCASDAMTDLPA